MRRISVLVLKIKFIANRGGTYMPHRLFVVYVSLRSTDLTHADEPNKRLIPLPRRLVYQESSPRAFSTGVALAIIAY